MFLAESLVLSLAAYAMAYAVVSLVALTMPSTVDMTGVPLSQLEGGVGGRGSGGERVSLPREAGGGGERMRRATEREGGACGDELTLLS